MWLIKSFPSPSYPLSSSSANVRREKTGFEEIIPVIPSFFMWAQYNGTSKHASHTEAFHTSPPQSSSPSGSLQSLILPGSPPQLLAGWSSWNDADLLAIRKTQGQIWQQCFINFLPATFLIIYTHHNLWSDQLGDVVWDLTIPGLPVAVRHCPQSWCVCYKSINMVRLAAHQWANYLHTL